MDFTVGRVEKIHLQNATAPMLADFVLEDGRYISSVVMGYPTPYEKFSLQLKQRFMILYKRSRYYAICYIPSDDDNTPTLPDDDYTILETGNRNRINADGNHFLTDFDYIHDTLEVE